MAQPRKNQVFISYASEDIETVKTISHGFEKRGLTVWFDKKNKKIGDWKPRILKAIARSRYFVFCLSEAALKKTGDEPGFQDEELDYAYEISMKLAIGQFTIVPIRLEDCDRGDHRLTRFQQYDYFEDSEACLDELAVEFGGNSLSHPADKDQRTENEKLIDSLMGKATVAYYAEDYHKALTLLETIIEELKPDYADVWGRKGLVLGMLGRTEEALVAYDRAIELNLDFAEAWYNKGVTLGALGRTEEALAAYDRAIELKPDLASAWYNKGVTLGALGRHEEALAASERAIELKPDHAKAWSNKSVGLGALGRYEEAFAASERAIELKPDHAEAWYNKGVALRELGQTEEALTAFDQATVLNPDLAQAWNSKGAALGNLGRYEEALAALEQAIELKPDHAEAWYNKGVTLGALGREEGERVPPPKKKKK